MTRGVGGRNADQVLGELPRMTDGIDPIGADEYRQRLARAQAAMRDRGMAAMFVAAGSNLRYFTGVRWNPSERLVGALVPAQGSLVYVAPAFEEGTLRSFQEVEGPVATWEEHEDPYRCLLNELERLDPDAHEAVVGLCPSLPFFMADALCRAGSRYAFVSAASVIEPLRAHKSSAEIALLQRAKHMTLAVHQAAASILRAGISTDEVTEFIRQAHRRVGAPGSTFCIVLFGADSAFPHGVNRPKALEEGDMVLIDTGCQLHGYQSDITRSYVFGTPSPQQRTVWEAEKAAQLAVFQAARPGVACSALDLAARGSLEAAGFGPGYKLPGLPHRTGHGIGLDLHEGPYLVGGDDTPLAPGICVSNEPMICVPGAFGVRLEDHFFMAEDGPRWFTEPSHSIDDPFGLAC